MPLCRCLLCAPNQSDQEDWWGHQHLMSPHWAFMHMCLVMQVHIWRDHAEMFRIVEGLLG